MSTDSSPEGWQWHLHCPLAEEPLWETLLWENFPGQWNLTTEAGRDRLRIEIVFPEEAEALAWRDEKGGKVQPLAPRDEWEKAQAAPPPIKIRDRFLVTSETDEAKLAQLSLDHPGRELLHVPAQLAFGTGQHATTRTCLRLLCDSAPPAGQDWRCLDLGTGSGILAIAARKLGASEVLAVENDPTALRVAEENATRNQVDGITFLEADVLEDQAALGTGPWDIILANLFSDVLKPLFPKLHEVSQAGTTLLFSGVLREQLPEVQQSAEAVGFLENESRAIGKWTAARHSFG